MVVADARGRLVSRASARRACSPRRCAKGIRSYATSRANTCRHTGTDLVAGSWKGAKELLSLVQAAEQDTQGSRDTVGKDLQPHFVAKKQSVMHSCAVNRRG